MREFGAAQPAFESPSRSLIDVLVASGAQPAERFAAARGFLRLWFHKEGLVLSAINAALSVILLLLALTMTLVGMEIAQALGLVPTLDEAMRDISPYAGVALLGLGSLRLIQHIAARGTGILRVFGFGEAFLLLACGVWAEAVAWYTGSLPYLLKPPLALAGGRITGEIVFFSVVVLPFFKPAMAAVAGLLLTAKQLKTTEVSGHAPARWFLAIVGLLASVCALVIGMNAGQRNLIRAPQEHQLATASGSGGWTDAFAPPLRQSTWCRVSDMFGPRRDPFDKTKIEQHPGIDLAARAGTPVLAMADGVVAYTGLDPGFGNMVAMKVSLGPHVETTLLSGHMERVAVEPGQHVAQGAVIGWVGSTGHSTGPHLHIQLCPEGHTHRGAFVCGVPRNPYEVWPALSAIARLACHGGPVGS